MTRIRFEYDIEKCFDCPACGGEMILTEDSFDHFSNYICNITNKTTATIEKNSEMPLIPKWCPQEIFDEE